MSPGRKLDKLVAEKIFGTQTATFDWDGETLPRPYSTDIDSAMLIVEKLREKKYALTLADALSSDGSWLWVATIHDYNIESIHLDEIENTIAEATADMAAHAICLATLRAMGIEIQD